jgi:hypothetical protein
VEVSRVALSLNEANELVNLSTFSANIILGEVVKVFPETLDKPQVVAECGNVVHSLTMAMDVPQGQAARTV